LGAARRRECPPSPDGGVIADYMGEVPSPESLAAWLDADPGVVAHGLFPPALVATVLVGRAGTVDRTDFVSA
ncbi:MAG TPA: hypothetical protein VKR22_05485, partial [Acidimicrobiales bacterium]|nr:hypothetical protein [Acidimicrobiales bacterium]